MSHRILGGLPLALMTGLVVACGGGNATAPQGPAPTLASVSPTTGTAGTELTLTGTNFRAGATVFLDSAAADSVQVANGTTAYALVPSGVILSHAYAVKIRNSDGTTAMLNSAFTPVAPVLQYLNG